MAGTSGRWRAVMAAAAVLALGRAATACSTPVFQYALERWSPDPYPALVFHKGKLSDADQKLVQRFEDAAYAEQCNLHMVAVDVEEELTGRIREVYERHSKAALPHVVVLYPERSFGQGEFWSGRLDAAALEELTTSPVRKEIARRILQEHHCGVWVLLESGDKKGRRAGRQDPGRHAGGSAQGVPGGRPPAAGARDQAGIGPRGQGRRPRPASGGTASAARRGPSRR